MLSRLALRVRDAVARRGAGGALLARLRMPGFLGEAERAVQRADTRALRAAMLRGGAAEPGAAYEEDALAVQAAARAGTERLLAALHLATLRSGRGVEPTASEREAGAEAGGDAPLLEALAAVSASPVPFRLEACESRVEGAGRGVRVASAGGEGPPARRGDVVALYPGLVYLRQRQADGAWEESVVWSARAAGEGVETAGDYLITRYDRAVIDGRVDAVALADDDAVPPPGYTPGTGAAADLATRPNAYALGHLANHPPAGERPNVAVCPLDVAEGDLSPQLLSYLPNRLWKPPGSFSRLFGLSDHLFAVRTVVLVALRDLEHGEELLVDYRFDPARPTPAWYTPVDAAVNQQRWGGGGGGETQPTK